MSHNRFTLSVNVAHSWWLAFFHLLQFYFFQISFFYHKCILPPGPHLTSEERRLIRTLHSLGFAPTETSAELSPSRESVYNVISNPHVNPLAAREGNLRDISATDHRNMLRTARYVMSTAPQVRDD